MSTDRPVSARAPATDRVILVTGVSRYLGAASAARLSAEPGVARVLAMDSVSPSDDIGSAEFVSAGDVPMSDLLDRAGVDTVVHAGASAVRSMSSGGIASAPAGVRETMQLLTACQRSRGLRRFVLPSATSVYGASPRDPAVFTADAAARSAPRSDEVKRVVEVEASVRGFARRRSDVAVLTLRLADVVGADVETSLAAYLDLPVVPVPLGFDARLQLLHQSDAVGALCQAARGAQPGAVVNIAGEGVLLLSQAVRRAGRIGVPLPVRPGRLLPGALGRLGVELSADELRLLQYGRVVDVCGAFDALGWRPSFSTAQAFDDSVRLRGHRGPLDPGIVRAVAGAAGAGAVGDAAEFVRRRLTGDYPVDDLGLDAELADQVAAVLRPVLRHWLRVQVEGLDHLPATGGALLVANRSAPVPVDGVVLQHAVLERTGRRVRVLDADEVFALPFAGSVGRKTGSLPALSADVTRLLAAGELVAVFPEATTARASTQEGTGPFERTALLAAAVRTGSVIVPCAISGGRGSYPFVADLSSLLRAVGLPGGFGGPVPWTGALGPLPLPARWTIELGAPIAPASSGTGAEASDDPVALADLAQRVRIVIDDALHPER